jgi:predicted outer membrane repeat protein
MTGGVISGNTATFGGGVYAGEITMTGGTIRNNTAKQGGGVYGSGNFSGGTVYGNNASAADRNTSTDGNTGGHAAFFHWQGDMSFSTSFSFYRDTSINPSDSLTGEVFSNIINRKTNLPASGQTLNGWTRR